MSLKEKKFPENEEKKDGKSNFEPEKDDTLPQETPEKSDGAPESADETPEEEDSAADDAQAKKNGEGAKEQPKQEQTAESENPPEEKKDEPQAEGTPPQAEKSPDADPANIELLQARAELAAFKIGIKANAVEDAVCLAVNDAKKLGTVDETTIAEALKGVTERHPEWKNGSDNSTGFRVGADSTKQTESSNDEIAKIFGNK